MFYHQLLGVVGAAAFQLSGPGSVGGGILPVEDSRGGQVDGPVQTLVVQVVAGCTWRSHCNTRWSGFGIEQGAADDYNVRRYHLVETGRGDQLAAAGVVGDRPGLGGHEHGLVPGTEGEYLEGPDDI